jgi:hypothetical protein
MYNSGFASTVSGSLEVASLQAAARMLCQRHEVNGDPTVWQLHVLDHALTTTLVLAA